MESIVDILLGYFHRICRYLPQIMIILSILVIIIAWFTGGVSFISKAAIILVPLIVASLICLLTKTNNIASDDLIFSLNIPQQRLYFLFGIVASLLLIWIELGNNDLIELLLLSILYLLIVLQLFSRNPKPAVILMEIMLTTAILTLPQMLVPAYYQAGGGDVFFHAYYASGIANYGFILPADVMRQYTTFNLYHIFLAVVSIITLLEVNVSLYIFTTVSFICAIPFIYLIARIFLKSSRACLFASLFYAITPIIMYYYIVPTPRIMGTIAFIIILYLLLRNWNHMKIVPFLLVVIVSSYMALVHHMQQPIFYVVVAFLCLGSLLYFKTIFIGNKLLLLTTCGISFVYIVYNYLATILSSLDYRLFGQIESNAITSFNLNLVSSEFEISTILAGLSSSIMVLFIFVALYFITTKPGTFSKILIFLPFLYILFVLFVPGVAEVFPSLTQAMQLQRFRLVWAALFALAMGLGCIILFNMLTSITKNKLIVLSVIIILCMAFVISSPILGYSKDNEIFYNNDVLSAREFYISETDVAAYDILISTLDSGTKVYTSHEWLGYTGTINLQKYLGVPYVETSHNMADVFTNATNRMSENEYILFNEGRYKRLNLEVLPVSNDYTHVQREYVLIEPTEENTNAFNRYTYYDKLIYVNGNNKLYN